MSLPQKNEMKIERAINFKDIFYLWTYSILLWVFS